MCVLKTEDVSICMQYYKHPTILSLMLQAAIQITKRAHFRNTKPESNNLFNPSMKTVKKGNSIIWPATQVIIPL